MSQHILTVSPSGDMSLSCPPGNGCSGYEECRDAHEVEGRSAAAGPFEHGNTPAGTACAPWCDEEQFEFHGVLHEWRYGWGWTVPFKGCVVAASLFSIDLPDEIGRDRPGRYVVDDEWEDEMCSLAYVASMAA